MIQNQIQIIFCLIHTINTIELSLQLNNMGKKQQQFKQETLESLQSASKLLASHKLKRIAKPIRNFLWQQTKDHKISFRTQNMLGEVINTALGQQKLQTQYDELFRKSQPSYQQTSKLFQSKSLKQKYRSLLGDSTGEEDSQEKQNILSKEEQQWLQKVRKVYKKYQVSSMYRKNLVKEVKRFRVENLVRKGYLREIQPGIMTLVS